MKKTLLTLALSIAAAGAFAQATPLGVWKSIDDETKIEKSLLRITETGGVFSARIEKLLDPATKQDAVCDKCSDDRKDKPLIGLQIVRNVKANASDKGLWDGGEILDPKDGKIYKVKLTPIEGGKKLEVRGFIGFALLGRTQTWIRAE